MKKEKILFIDRDGTLVQEPEKTFQINKINEIILEPNVILVLSELKKNGYKFVIVTNQDNLGTSSYLLEDFYRVQNFLIDLFFSQGIFFEDILICPHNEKENCNCRKPKTKMIDIFLKKRSIKKKKSYVIGDRNTDLQLGKNLKIKSFLYNRNECNWIKIKERILKNNRFAEICRCTSETSILLSIRLDSCKSSKIYTGIGFFDHMLEQVAVHSGISMNVLVKENNLNVDDHHLVEDVAITLGKAIKKALGKKIGIRRYGFLLPMDESIAKCALDLSGRPYCKFHCSFKYQKIGNLSTQMIKHFFYTLSYSLKCSLHFKAKGKNDHHLAESIFKSFGQVLRQAIFLQGNSILTSKGVL